MYPCATMHQAEFALAQAQMATRLACRSTPNREQSQTRKRRLIAGKIAIVTHTVSRIILTPHAIRPNTPHVPWRFTNLVERNPLHSVLALWQCENHGLTTTPSMAPAPDFIISTVAALVCWRALKKNDGPAPTWPPPASRQEKNVQPHLEGQAADNDPTSQAPSSTPTLSTPTEKASARKGAGSRARKRGGTSPLPLGLRWLLLLSWNIACTGSLLVTIAWFTEDVSER